MLDFVNVVLVSALGRFLNTHLIHVVDHASVRTQLSVLGKEIIRLVRLHHLHHRIALVCAGRLYRLQIMQGGRVSAGVRHRRDCAGTLNKAFAPLARGLVTIPVKAGCQAHIAVGRSIYGFGIRGEHQQANHGRLLIEAELTGRFQGVDEVLAGVGKRDSISAGSLGLQYKGGEVSRAERRFGRTDDFTTVGVDHTTGDLLQSVAESVIGRDEEPLLLASFDQRLNRAVGQRHDVICPVRVVRGAGFGGEGVATGATDQRGLGVRRQDLRGGPYHTAGHQTIHGINLLAVDPLAHFGRAEVRLVLIIGRNNVDGRIQYLTAKVFNRHFDGLDTVLATDIPVRTIHIRQNTDTNLIIRNRSECIAHESAGDRQCRQCFFHVFLQLVLIFMRLASRQPTLWTIGYVPIRPAIR